MCVCMCARACACACVYIFNFPLSPSSNVIIVPDCTGYTENNANNAALIFGSSVCLFITLIGSRQAEKLRNPFNRSLVNFKRIRGGGTEERASEEKRIGQ